MNNLKQWQTNFLRFTAGPFKYFKIIGVSLEPPDTVVILGKRILTVLTIAFMLAHQIGYIIMPERTLAEQSAAIGLINYSTVSGGKILCLIFNRHLLQQSYADLKAIYPHAALERHYRLERHLRIYTRVETILYNFCICILIVYCLSPIGQSLYDLHANGVYSYRLPALFWYPVPVEDSLPVYLFYMLFQCYTTFAAALVILSADLCLFSSVSQLILHLDLLSGSILELEPTDIKGSLRMLRAIIEYHQRILLLAENVNKIFAPSIIFSLASSSFILCFSAYQLLDDVSFVFACKILFLLCYEMKQVFITCYFGDKLMVSSINLFHVLYAHNWTDGTPAYKRLVLLMMIRTRRPIALNVTGIVQVSLITLKEVLRTSYQIFAVLKSA